MIRGLILDVDGVIVGGKSGYNFPDPHKDVIVALRQVKERGMMVSFCTAKPGFVIGRLVRHIGLDSLHISNGGAELTNFAKDKSVVMHSIDPDAAGRFVTEAIQAGLYTEGYTTKGYAIEENAYCNLTKINVSILHTKPELVASLPEFVRTHETIKIMPAAFNERDKEKILRIIKHYPTLQLQWGRNPMYAPALFGVVTKNGITKESGLRDLVRYTDIPFGELLGVGDGESDWEFMQHCGYIATLKNAVERVKSYVRQKGNVGYIGKSVDENGILDILKHFGVI